MVESSRFELVRPQGRDWIRALRYRAGYSQSDLAGLTGISQGGLSKVESGDTLLSDDQFSAIQRVLSLDPGEERALVTGTNPWSAAHGLDGDGCYSAYDAYWRQSAIHDDLGGETRGLELTSRVIDLIEQGEPLDELLRWVLTSRTYWLMVRGRHGEACHLAKWVFQEGLNHGFDQTSGYSIWALARPHLSRRGFDSRGFYSLNRLVEVAEGRGFRCELPYLDFVKAAKQVYEGDGWAADEALRRASSRVGEPDGRGQFGVVGSEYWFGTVQSYRGWFALKARTWRDFDLIREFEQVTSPVPRLLTRLYHAASLPHEPERRELVAMASREAEELGLGYAWSTMRDHVKRICPKMTAELR